LTRSKDGHHKLVQLIRYAASRGSGPLTLAVSGRYRSATLRSFELKAPAELKPISRQQATEVQLPEFSVYAAIELGV
jgi:hypothetical protein